ncbi:hypothetical protein DID88_003207 [Monilinia fructigena]|uniref:Peptidase M20 dimerisation domain-containing protein n=1 Tax=Monilinia fructigena TaxID=38457 RepID=A0A395J084_9HELO|nr:hypothetical protein DID88_003207 [Monilinia fructigena]
MSRLALSDSDKQARDWFVETTKALGCDVKIDAMGNIFAVRPGRKNAPPTYAGSHLDTQPTGGRYDGILGVHAGIEALRTMNDLNIQTEFPTEEGARFPKSMVSSGVWAHDIPLSSAHNLLEVNGTAAMKSELERIGYLGSMPASYSSNPIGAHFELHIEQGPILERSKTRIGVVTGVQAYSWHTITVRGRDCHTGTTDFENRSDAMLTAAKLILHSHNKAAEMGCLASTGILTLKPGSTNTVPGLPGAVSNAFMRMVSGAGHDRIFVPCKDGVSHNPAEYCSPEDCGNGAQVLLGAILRYDRIRASRGA